MKKILALVGVLVIASYGYSQGWDTGIIVLVIVTISVTGALFYLFYRRHGLRGIANGFLRAYDPELPPLPGEEEEPFVHTEALPASRGEERRSLRSSAPLSQPEVASLPSTGQLGSVTVEEVQRSALPAASYGSPGAARLLPAPSTQAAPATPRYVLHLGPNAYVRLEEAFINTLLLDPTGSNARVLAEELANQHIPLLFLDVTGEFTSLLVEFPQGRGLYGSAASIPEAHRSRAVVLGQDQIEAATDFGHRILQEGLQVLFSSRSFSSVSEAATVFWRVFEGMVQWESHQKRQHGHSMQAGVFVSDAHWLCPDDLRHSPYRDIPTLAEKVRQNVLYAVSRGGNWGIWWYLLSRRISGMDPEVLRALRLWMIHRPLPAEVRGGWLTPYTGVQPGQFELLPSEATLIIDRQERVPQQVLFRPSRSLPVTAGRPLFTLPALVPSQQQQEAVHQPPFPQG